jgi:hypothetical protein
LLLLLLLRRVGPDGSKAREDVEAHETPDSRLYRVSSSGPLPFERCASYAERIAHETDAIAIYQSILPRAAVNSSSSETNQLSGVAINQ